MNQIFNEIDDDLKKDRILNFFKKYKFIIISILLLVYSARNNIFLCFSVSQKTANLNMNKLW